MDKGLILQSLEKIVRNESGSSRPTGVMNLDQLGFLDTSYLRTFAKHPRLYMESLSLLARSSIDLAYYYASSAVMAQFCESVGGRSISLTNILDAHSEYMSHVEFVPNYLGIEAPLFIKKAGPAFIIYELPAGELLEARGQSLLALNSLNFKTLSKTVGRVVGELNVTDYQRVRTFVELSFVGLFLGLMQGSYMSVESYVEQRTQGGRVIKDWPVVADQLRFLKSSVTSMEAGAYALKLEEPDRIAGMLATSSRLALELVSKAMDLMGGYGYMKDYPIEKFFRSVHVLSALGVSYEIQSSRK
ncbi:MAG: acyl-CoA/acyl-ACP dehydrogenase [Bdellovibrionales bacterium]|nr:acyl-CoA/acyl-ACP dehydrogenase [Bdellovibrionales bacterium]